MVDFNTKWINICSNNLINNKIIKFEMEDTITKNNNIQIEEFNIDKFIDNIKKNL